MNREAIASHLLLTIEKRNKYKPKRSKIVKQILEQILEDKEEFVKKVPPGFKNSYRL